MDFGIRGRRAIVAAASSGLGRACADALLREGCEVTILARDRGRLERAAEALGEATGTTPKAVALDVSDGEAVDAFVARETEAGGTDILVTNSGGPPAKPFAECTLEDWSRATDLMLLSAVRLIRGFLPGMVDRAVADGRAASREEVLDGWTKNIPAGHLGDPATFGRAVAFLCSEACPFISGHNLMVDGGEARTTF